MARDLFHENVKTALIKDGWVITHDPYELELGRPEYEIDLGAEKILAATKGKQKIAVEVKSFTGKSTAYEFHQAVGQYRNYKSALNDIEPEREIFLAIPENVFNDFFTLPFPAKRIKEDTIKIIVFSHTSNLIISWIA